MAAKQTCWEYTCLPNTNSIPPQHLDAIRGWTTGPHSSSEYYNNARKYKKISIKHQIGRCSPTSSPPECPCHVFLHLYLYDVDGMYILGEFWDVRQIHK